MLFLNFYNFFPQERRKVEFFRLSLGFLLGGEFCQLEFFLGTLKKGLSMYAAEQGVNGVVPAGKSIFLDETSMVSTYYTYQFG